VKRRSFFAALATAVAVPAVPRPVFEHLFPEAPFFGVDRSVDVPTLKGLRFGTAVVTSVDRGKGRITFDVDTPVAVHDDDYVFFEVGERYEMS
jgi:hypothetical protein